MASPISTAGEPKVITASTCVMPRPGELIGISAADSTTGSFILYDSLTTAAATMLPAFTLLAGSFLPVPASFGTGLYLIATGTVNLTLYVRPN